jgi:2-polyprenyl-3-methyl-5-hydroxy-6-metoxy-1,4-benzoquinol methylase
MMKSNMPSFLPEFVKRMIRYAVVRPRRCRSLPRHLKMRHSKFDRASLRKIQVALENHGVEDISAHLSERLELFRYTVVPWLDSSRPLKGMRILEIGCGTGSSSLALAEQGAFVLGLDIDKQSLAIASKRCNLAGEDGVEFLNGNASNVSDLVDISSFDLIIFFAALEHMTYQERIDSIASTFNGMRDDALWCVVDTPNRIWYYDSHTSLLPFFHWLPEEVAMEYGQFCSRDSFRGRMQGSDSQRPLRLARTGRGISFHEWDLAIGKDKWRVCSCLENWLAAKNRPRGMFWRITPEGQYEAFLKRICPQLPSTFKMEYINAIFTKV